jgi:hypothetical protein
VIRVLLCLFMLVASVGATSSTSCIYVLMDPIQGGSQFVTVSSLCFGNYAPSTATLSIRWECDVIIVEACRLLECEYLSISDILR